MIKLTAIILAKNAEDMIADCLDSVSFCDEIIVIDDGSTDRTAEIAKHMDAKVFSLIDRDFAQRRNYGLRKAKGKWVFYIDTDERVSPALRKEIESVISENDGFYAAYRVPRKNFYFGNHEWPYVEMLERLFKRTSLKEWHGELHETASVDGNIGDLVGDLLHYTRRDLTSMVAKTAQWSQIEAELRFNANHPKMTWWRFFRVIWTGFYGSYIKQKGYKAGTAGLVESMYQGFSMFITYARLWEMQNKFETKKEI